MAEMTIKETWITEGQKPITLILVGEIIQENGYFIFSGQAQC